MKLLRLKKHLRAEKFSGAKFYLEKFVPKIFPAKISAQIFSEKFLANFSPKIFRAENFLMKNSPRKFFC